MNEQHTSCSDWVDLLFILLVRRCNYYKPLQPVEGDKLDEKM